MTRLVRLFSITLLTLTSACIANAQAGAVQSSGTKPGTGKDASAINNKAAREAEAERILKERRALAEGLLIALAADADKFSDQILRARTQARIAETLWAVDAERARTLFRKAWDAAEEADKEGQRKLLEEVAQQKAKSGGSFAVASPPNLRGEVLRLAARCDRALGEEFLAKLKAAQQQEATEASDRTRRDPSATPEALKQRLGLARQLLDTDVERALQFADPVLGTISMDGLNFLSYLRDKDAAAADRRYAALLANAAGSLQSDANTVSLFASYLFTPHLFVMFSPDGGHWTNQTSPNTPPPDIAPELRLAFFNVATQILLRPQPPPEQDQSSSGIEGKYLVIKRLLPLFEQYAPKEATDAVRAQMEALATGLPDALRERDDDSVRQGIRPPQKSEDREKALLDQIDHVKTSAERDRLYLMLARIAAERGDLKSRDYVDKIEDSELRDQVRAYVDVTMAMQAIDKKDAERALELARTGELSHIQRVWVLTQAAKLLAKSNREKSLRLLDDATTEARRIDASDPDRPRALMAVANTLLAIERPKAWDAADDAIRAANSAEGFTGEDGVIRISLVTKGMSSVRSNSAQDFDVTGIFAELARDDYNRTVELARGFEREAPRASAVIAIARSVLESKDKANKN